MQNPIKQKLKNAAAIFTGVAVLAAGSLSFNSCGKLPMHERMFAPQGQFSEKPSEKELRGNAGGKNGIDSAKSPGGKVIFAPKLFPDEGKLWEAPSKSELPNQNLRIRADTAGK